MAVSSQATRTDSAERDDGPDAMGVVLWLAIAAMLVFGAGVYVGFSANVDAWYVALRAVAP